MTHLADALSPSQAGRILGLSARRVCQLCDSGALACVMTPLGRLIPRGEVEALAARRA